MHGCVNYCFSPSLIMHFLDVDLLIIIFCISEFLDSLSMHHHGLLNGTTLKKTKELLSLAGM